MGEEGKFMAGGRPVELTPEEVGRIRRTQWYMLLAASGGSVAFMVIMLWLGPLETGPLFAILAAISAPSAVAYLVFRRTAVQVLSEAARRRDLG